MSKNKKGFTIVELLAVIVILGVLVSVAVLAIKPRSRQAQKKAFINDAKAYLKAAKQAYTLDDEDGEFVCYNISDLEEYVKKDDVTYSGTIISEFTDGSSNQVISITDGQYYLFGNESSTIDDVSESAPVGFKSSCDGYENIQPVEVGTSTLAYRLFMNEGKSTLTENLSLIDERTYAANFSNVETNPARSGMYKAEDDDGMSYYYRGVVNNNWVSFGGFYWRIIRINGDGSIRLIYSGLPSSNHTGTNAGIKNSKNSYSTIYSDATSYKASTIDISGLTTNIIQSTYVNGRHGTPHVGYMYNPKFSLGSFPAASLSSSRLLNTFTTYTSITATKNDYYFFKNFDMNTDCFVGNDTDETGACTLKCRKLGNDGDTGIDCVKSNWNVLATTAGNYSTTATGVYPATNPTQYVYTSPYKYTCWGNGTPVERQNSDGTISVYISCPIVSEIIGTVKNQQTQAKTKFHGLFSESPTVAYSNLKESNAKKEIDIWYENNILHAKDSDNIYNLEDYIVDEVFCNDRTSTSTIENFPMSINGGVYPNSPYTRIVTSKLPSYKCPDMGRDAFTLSSTANISSVSPRNIGNQLLKYPVGLLTSDEASYAGGKYNAQNKDYWLYIGYSFDTMSPYGFTTSNLIDNVWYVNGSNGGINGANTASGTLIRPVINLKADVVYKSGSGTETDPYIITL